MARTDLMRVIIYVPDRDTPLLDRGDPAVVRIDALGGEEFKGKVARFSEFELPTNRTMRTEVDLPNPTGRLRMGMYGPVSILLEPPTDFLTIPSKALHEARLGRGVRLRRRGRPRPQAARSASAVTTASASRCMSGLSTDDQVIIQYTGSIEDGEPVVAESIGEGQGSRASGGPVPSGRRVKARARARAEALDPVYVGACNLRLPPRAG